MKSWKTTLGGALTAGGMSMMGAGTMDWLKPDHKYWCMLSGFIMTVVGPIIMGLFARDNDKSSEDVGAKKTDS